MKELGEMLKESEELKMQLDDIAAIDWLTCNVCRDNAKGKLVFECNECGHWICEDCNRNPFDNCPMCRTSLRENPLRRSQMLKRV